MSNSLRLAQLRRVAVGSGNRVKVEAVRAVFIRAGLHIAVESSVVQSDVPDQPRGDDETIRGARTRAERARAVSSADMGVGIEGGVVALPDGSLRTCAWAVVVDRDGRSGTGGSLAMPLPPAVAALIAEGLELGDAMDRLTGTRDVKYGAGASGILTGGLVDRQAAYESIVTYALAPWLAGDHWA